MSRIARGCASNMSGFWDLSLIRFLDFYLALIFLASVIRRIDLYRSVVALVMKVPGRWPHLLKVVQQHRTILLGWPLVAPAVLALVLLLLQLIASRLIWPEAARPPNGLTTARLAEYWLALAVVVPLGLFMVGLDIYGLITVGQVDKALLEKYFDQAEYWMRSRTAHVVRIFTFGFVNPRAIVSLEVRKALDQVTKMLATSLRWLVLVLVVRLSFGLSLWLTWALTSS